MPPSAAVRGRSDAPSDSPYSIFRDFDTLRTVPSPAQSSAVFLPSSSSTSSSGKFPSSSSAGATGPIARSGATAASTTTKSISTSIPRISQTTKTTTTTTTTAIPHPSSPAFTGTSPLLAPSSSALISALGLSATTDISLLSERELEKTVVMIGAAGSVHALRVASDALQVRDEQLRMLAEQCIARGMPQDELDFVLQVPVQQLEEKRNLEAVESAAAAAATSTALHPPSGSVGSIGSNVTQPITFRRPVRKAKSSFRLPFFWRPDEDEGAESLSVSTALSAGTSATSASGSSRRVSKLTPPLFSDDEAGEDEDEDDEDEDDEDDGGRSYEARMNALSKSAMSTTSSSSSNIASAVRNNVNNFVRRTTAAAAAMTSKSEDSRDNYDSDREQAACSSDDDDLVVVNEKGDEVLRASSANTSDDEGFGPASLFRSALQSPSNAASTSESPKKSGIREHVNSRPTTWRNPDGSMDEKLGHERMRFPAESSAFYPTATYLHGRTSLISQHLPDSHLLHHIPHTQVDSGVLPPNAGPVELENIVPQSIQPPTLLQSWNDHYRSEDTYLLTDRFGFIYDTHHKPVLPPTETGASVVSVGARFLDNFDDFFDREPSAPPRPPSTEEGSDSLSKPEPAHLVGGSQQQQRGASLTSGDLEREEAAMEKEDPLETVRTLLAQLTDLHDSLQRAQKSRWDEFLRKISELSGVGGDGSASAAIPTMMLESGEVFGLYGRALSGNKYLNGRSRYKEFRALVLGGIPVVYRSKIWSECGGADSVKVPGEYDELVNAETTGDVSATEAEACAQIDLDLFRTMPSNVFFGGKGPGVPKLKRVLLAFSRRNPKIGYCQGMNMIAATLLLTHPTEEDAFWSFVSLIEKTLPEGYFSPPLTTSRADQRVLKAYLRELQPKLYDHLDNDLGVDIEAITFNWFLSCFTDCLPAEVLFRVWDVFICLEGEPYLFRVALALFRVSSKQLLALRSAAEVYSFMKDMAARPISIEGLIRLADSLRTQVRDDDVKARRKVEIQNMEDELDF
ncbi:rab-GTPase-TBC domain-containing protein [Limtongia smithiae]|uniref:rab-GTPase-TBC domain-containing protein n=1 Tax=Limtongia smithiae TaxID=1125753 RepID=UPI0034CF3B41